MRNTPPQHRAIRNYRKQLTERGMARFEVIALDSDRELIRSLAKRLSDNESATERIRTTVRRSLSAEGPGKGAILAALRRPPMVGADLDLTRPVVADREVGL